MFFCFEYLLQDWVVANHKSFKCLTSNGNPYESLVRNFLDAFRIEGLLYLGVLTLFFFIFYVLDDYVLYFSHLLFFSIENKRHNITLYLSGNLQKPYKWKNINLPLK
jgi:hypothetical protein